MSWGFSYAGNGKAVAEKVRNENAYAPEGLKQAVEEIGERVPYDRVLYVDSSGHCEVRHAEDKPYDPKNPGDGDIVYGSGVLTFKILPKVE